VVRARDPDSCAELRACLKRTIAPLVHASTLPGWAYATSEAFDIDRMMFERVWLPVAHVSEVTEPGSFVASEPFADRFIVARGADFALRGFIDRCAHRGTPLTDGDSGRLANLTIVCPYHGLSYDLSGRASELSSATLGLASTPYLTPVRVAEWGGFVFACRSDRAPDLHAWMGPSPPWIARASMHALRLARRRVHTVKANWKLCVENFQEAHHFTLVHPGLQAVTPWSRSSSVDFGAAWLGGSMEIRQDVQTVSVSGRMEGRHPVASEEDARTVRDAMLFPAWLTSLQPDYFLSYRLVPTAPDQTTIIADIFFHAETPPRGDAADDVFTFWDRTNAEDRAICERQHRGVTAPSYRPGAYASSDDGVHAFDRRVARAYVDVLAPEVP
jgi:Rieske 2Fe-2S family protein